MAERCESSGLHSLASLREHETRRAQQQAEAARARAEAEQRARQASERAEQERRRAERAAREYAESTQRAELVSLENAQRAELERAEGLLRASLELKAQLESERVARRAVELGLTSRLLRQRLWTCASAALCVAGGLSAIGLYFGAFRPNAERAVATAQNALVSERRELSEVQQREARSKLRMDELSSQVGSLQRTLYEEREQRATQAPATNRQRSPVKVTPKIVPPILKPCRDDGDPLNPCLKR